MSNNDIGEIATPPLFSMTYKLKMHDYPSLVPQGRYEGFFIANS